MSFSCEEDVAPRVQTVWHRVIHDATVLKHHKNKTTRIQEDGVVEEVQRFHEQVLVKKRKGQTRKGGREDDGEEEKN